MDDAANAFLRHVRPLWGRLNAVARSFCARRDDAADVVTATEAEELLAKTKEFKAHVETWLRKHHPNLA